MQLFYVWVDVLIWMVNSRDMTDMKLCNCCCFRLTYVAKWPILCKLTWVTWGETMWRRHTSQRMLGARPKKMARPMYLNQKCIWQGYVVESQGQQLWPKQIWPDQLMSNSFLTKLIHLIVSQLKQETSFERLAVYEIFIQKHENTPLHIKSLKH